MSDAGASTQVSAALKASTHYRAMKNGRRSIACVACFRYVLFMPDNVQSAMLEILKRIQADVSEVKADVSSLKSDVADLKVRMERVERLVKKQIRDNAGMLVMFRATVGEFNERVTDLEEDERRLKEPTI